MKTFCRAAAWVMLLGLGLSVGHGQPPTQPPDLPTKQPDPPTAKPGGVSTRTLAPQAMKLSANGQYLRVYPKDALKPFDSTDFYAERPVTVTKVEYDAKTQELLVAVEFGWANADEEKFRASIVEKYRDAGRPVDLKAITIIPLDVVNYSLVIRDGNQCQYCGRKFVTSELSLDHVIPRSQGGGTTWENIVCACVDCNVRKGGRTPRQANMTLVRKPEKPKRSPVLNLKLSQKKYQTWQSFLETAYWSVELK